MTLLSVTGPAATVKNPAFCRTHPTKNLLYTCTEDIVNPGSVLTYEIVNNGLLRPTNKPICAKGTSTCYLTINKKTTRLLACNYWNSSLLSFPLNPQDGEVSPHMALYDPHFGKEMKIATKTANHSANDASTIATRQSDPHSHALVLDPYHNCIAFVPDLGMDLIRQMYFNEATGEFTQLSEIKSGKSKAGHPDGPRYIEFHKTLPIVYVINELSSSVAVFSVNKKLIDEIAERTEGGNKPIPDELKGINTLTMVQNIDTVPSAYPLELNTCGRITVHNCGNYVLVSNRGHDSVAVFRIVSKGRLEAAGYFHTRGHCPRHFQFDSSGQWLIVANQDSDHIAVFHFNLSTGELAYSGNSYNVPSPNFVCAAKWKDSGDTDSDDSE